MKERVPRQPPKRGFSPNFPDRRSRRSTRSWGPAFGESRWPQDEERNRSFGRPFTNEVSDRDPQPEMSLEELMAVDRDDPTYGLRHVFDPVARAQHEAYMSGKPLTEVEGEGEPEQPEVLQRKADSSEIEEEGEEETSIQAQGDGEKQQKVETLSLTSRSSTPEKSTTDKPDNSQLKEGKFEYFDDAATGKRYLIEYRIRTNEFGELLVIIASGPERNNVYRNIIRPPNTLWTNAADVTFYIRRGGAILEWPIGAQATLYGGDEILSLENESLSQGNQQSSSWLPEPLQWALGIVQGDFNENQDAGQIAIRTLLTMIPGIDQIADVQDLIAALYKLGWERRYNEMGPWFDLFITAIGLIPTAGSALKGVAKYLRRAGGQASAKIVRELLSGVADHLVYFAGRADEAAAAINGILNSLSTATTTFVSRAWQTLRGDRKLKPFIPIFEPFLKKLDELRDSFDEIIKQINDRFDEVSQELQRLLDDALGRNPQLATPNGAPIPPNRVDDGKQRPLMIEGESFSNGLPDRLAEELQLARRLGVRPLRIGEAGFDEVINEGTIKWAVTESGELLVIPKYVNGEEISHSVINRGQPVKAAGEAEIAGANGQYILLDINNHSGHYRPSSNSLDIGRRVFAENGIE